MAVPNSNSDNINSKDRTRSGPVPDSSPGGGGGGGGSTPWSSIYSTPTTLAGYGITDAVLSADLADVAFSGLASDVLFASGVGLTSHDVAAALDELYGLIGSGPIDAVDVTYDPTTSGLTSTDVQAAIDELAATGGGGGPAFLDFSVQRVATQAVATNASTSMSYDAENWDTAGTHDLSTNPTRVTCPTGKAGKWHISAAVYWEANSSGVRFIEMLKNGVSIVPPIGCGYNPLTSSTPVHTCDGYVDMAAGDYLELSAYQNSGSTLNMTGRLQGMLGAGGGGFSIDGGNFTDPFLADPSDIDGGTF